MGVAGVWVERCCVRFMAQSKTRCLKTVITPSVPLTRLKRKKPTRWLPPTGSGHRFFEDRLLQQALAALLHAVASHGLVDDFRRSRFSTQLAGLRLR